MNSVVSKRLRITEIFYSLQGESSRVGLPTAFIRLTGCPLRCVYCDTEYAFEGGQWFEFEQILDELKSFNACYVTLTGGEPLAQKNSIPFLRLLCDQAYKVSLETSGALDISLLDARVVKVMDLKTPSSGECEKNRFENIRYLQSGDEVKFVIANLADYQWSKSILEQYSLLSICEVLFSPVHDKLKPAILAEWILQDKIQVRFQLQLHKVLWRDARAK